MKMDPYLIQKLTQTNQKPEWRAKTPRRKHKGKTS